MNGNKNINNFLNIDVNNVFKDMEAEAPKLNFAYTLLCAGTIGYSLLFGSSFLWFMFSYFEIFISNIFALIFIVTMSLMFWGGYQRFKRYSFLAYQSNCMIDDKYKEEINDLMMIYPEVKEYVEKVKSQREFFMYDYTLIQRYLFQKNHPNLRLD